MEMTDNLMKYNAEVVHYSTCSALTDAGIYNLARICMREKFDKNNAEIYGTDATTDNFTKINLEDTPYFELYEENNGDGLTVVSYDEETNQHAIGIYHKIPTPEFSDNYVNDSVIFPRENSFTRGKVIGRK